MARNVDFDSFSTVSEIIDYLKDNKRKLSDLEKNDAREVIYKRFRIGNPIKLTEAEVKRVTTPVLQFMINDHFIRQPVDNKQLMIAEVDRRQAKATATKKGRPILDSTERCCKNLDPETRAMTDEEYRKKLDNAKRARDRDESLTQAAKWLFFGIACIVCLFFGVGNTAITIGGLVVCALLFALNLYEA